MSVASDRREERERQAHDLLETLRRRSGGGQYGWGNDMSVEAGLLLEGFRFEFVQAVRLLSSIAQRMTRASGGGGASLAAPERSTAAPLPEVEHAPEDSMMSEEAHASASLPRMDERHRRLSIRLRSRIGFDFPPGSTHRVRLSPDVVGQIEIIANLMALGGNNAPLPEPFAELVLHREKLHDNGLRDFLDIFHHRLLELYYTSTLHTAPWLALVHPAANELAQMVYSLAGLGPQDLRNRMHMPDRVWLRYASLLWHRPRSASSLAAILSDHFGVPVRIGEPVGRWFDVEPEDQCRLGSPAAVLGRTATLGSRICIANAGVQLHLGPMDARTFEGFLPGGKLHRQILEMVRFFVRDNITPEMHLQLDRQDVRSARLGEAKLGWTCWLRPAAEGAPLHLKLTAV